jgi:hypothetical protein
MTDDDDDDEDIRNFLDAMDRALAVHEAGHAVVAHGLGADVVFVEINLKTGDGGSQSSNFADNIRNLAVCVAGCRAEHLLEAPSSRKTKIGDFRLMRELLSRFPDPQRRAARAEGYRLANETLKTNAEVMNRIAGELLARRWSSEDAIVRTEGEELAELLAGVVGHG